MIVFRFGQVTDLWCKLTKPSFVWGLVFCCLTVLLVPAYALAQSLPTPNMLNQNLGAQMGSRGALDLRPKEIEGGQVDFQRWFSAPSVQGLNVDQLSNLGLLRRPIIDKKIFESPEGFIAVKKLSFNIPFGVCSKQRNREVLGVCGVKQDPRERFRNLSNPNSKFFIPSESARRIITQQMQTELNQLNGDVLKAREFLSGPQAQQKLTASEIQRLRNLSDEDLAYEMMNSGDEEIEEAIFIPRAAMKNIFPKLNILKPKNIPTRSPKVFLKKSELQDERILFSGFPKSIDQNWPADQQAAAGAKLIFASTTARSGTRNLTARRSFIAGFTFSKNFEWKVRFKKTVSWCWVGCKRTYYVEPYAQFGYGLGFRVPIRVELAQEYKRGRAFMMLNSKIEAVNAQPGVYRSAGMSEEQVFGGKEIVAEYTAKAGIKYKLPTLGSGDYGVDYSKDLTDYLPGNLRGGQFDPPEPGNPTPGFEKVFSDINLLAGRGDYGLFGAEIYPALKGEFTSGMLTVMVQDKTGGGPPQIIGSGDSARVAVDPNIRAGEFSVGQPKYNMSFTITPGVGYMAFIDLVVWRKEYPGKIWIPDLKLVLPPQGIDFGCHQGTKCVHDIKMTAFGSENAPPVTRAPTTPPPSASNESSSNLSRRSTFEPNVFRGNVREMYEVALIGGGNGDFETQYRACAAACVRDRRCKAWSALDQRVTTRENCFLFDFVPPQGGSRNRAQASGLIIQ